MGFMTLLKIVSLKLRGFIESNIIHDAVSHYPGVSSSHPP